MAIKKISITLATFFVMGMANAQYMGIDSLATTEGFTPKLLGSAIQGLDTTFVAQWGREKGWTLPYSEKEACVRGSSSDIRSLTEAGKVENKNGAGYIGHLGVTQGYTHFSSCSGLPLLMLAKKSNFLQTPTYLSFIGKSPDSANQEQKFVNQFITPFFDGLEANQWDMLVPIILDPNVDYPLRLKALAKFKENYPKHMSTATQSQKTYWEAAKKEERENGLYVANHGSHDVISDPVYYMFDHLTRSILQASDVVKSSREYKNGVVPYFSKNYWLGKEKLQPKDLFAKGSTNDYYSTYMRLYVQAEMMREILKIKGLNLNKQNFLGNTYLHRLFSHEKANMLLLEDNLIMANFIRALLESGADPRILNKDNKSGFMQYELQKGQTPYKQQVLRYMTDAFLLKQYDK